MRANRWPRQPAGHTFWQEITDLQRAALYKVGVHRYRPARTTCSLAEANLAVLTRGWARLEIRTSSIDYTVMDLAGPGELLSPLHILDPHPPHWLGTAGLLHYTMLTKGNVLEVPRGAAMALLNDFPRMLGLILQIQTGQHHLALHEQASRRLPAEARLAGLVLSLLYRYGDSNGPDSKQFALTAPLSQRDLAVWIGASEASVTRTIRKWRRSGLITTGRRFLSILNPRGLAAIAVPDSADHSIAPAARDRRTSPEPYWLATLKGRQATSQGLVINSDLPPGLSRS
ncbi:Crp/Fnr family transcriptional regulator [Nonomuraea typhae]|uniref:Crp/Fnr family transcriptional regulator n=1 Tax=Nonomuraea typhae TaxID=2603600 RepID=UPI0012FA2312|nr:Crp/Fnr family transcriptional regulator [Nonomuraea typhae]